MEYINSKTGLIIFTHNDADLERPSSLISGFINFFQTWRLRNKKHNATHTAQVILFRGKVYAIDSDRKGIIPMAFDKWKQGRAWLHIFDPNELKGTDEEDMYIEDALQKSGDNYGYEDIVSWLWQQFTGDFEGETDPNKADDNMLCIYFTQYLYRKYIKEWWKGSPLKLQKARFTIFPNGKDVYSGKPENITFI